VTGPEVLPSEGEKGTLKAAHSPRRVRQASDGDRPDAQGTGRAREGQDGQPKKLAGAQEAEPVDELGLSLRDPLMEIVDRWFEEND